MKNNALTNQQLNEITEAILAGRKIEAIKTYRIAAGVGLKEAKQEIDRITDDLAEEHPELKEAKGAGCASVIALGFGVTVALGCTLEYLSR
ncbi:hypothetical protein [Rubellicoccus peritrichatus]|uniref:Ribosomal protein L7/L12 C-terminal domain-containing protein n=1 Tax=Rubellicoccus peritrichatus TaxID=3080537 RepID=A0AAQ3LEQ0_9BACT|nr:hypothetical protein [Puniceicoccus sp. CR14]WOO42565.1 hypothetical protein RZN69_05640 [Puniceicoccus sp. CR14]